MKKNLFGLLILILTATGSLSVMPIFASDMPERGRNTKCTLSLSRLSDDTLITFIVANMNKDGGKGFFRWDATKLVEAIDPLKLFEDVRTPDVLQHFYGQDHNTLRISSSVTGSSEFGHLVNVVTHIEKLFQRSFPEEKLVIGKAGILKTGQSSLAPNQYPNINSSYITVTIPLIGMGTRYFPTGDPTNMLTSRTKHALAFNGAWRGKPLVHAATTKKGPRLLLKILLQPKEEKHRGRSFKTTRFALGF